jgi:hypothetical protein
MKKRTLEILLIAAIGGELLLLLAPFVPAQGLEGPCGPAQRGVAQPAVLIVRGITIHVSISYVLFGFGAVYRPLPVLGPSCGSWAYLFQWSPGSWTSI